MKANRRVKRAVITLLLIAGGFFLCNFFYLVLDQLLNGFVRDWFDRNYVYHEWVAVADGQEGYYTATIRWARVKELVFEIFLVGVVLLVLVIRLISVAYASYREKQVIRAAGKMINDFMRHDREASEVFPAEYAEVSLQMAEIKAAMQRQEQLQKEEAGRKNDLITYLAHDLKTPLTSVIGYLTLLREETQISPELREKYLSISLEKAERLEDLINEFFEITRFNLTHLELETVTVSLKRMLEQIIYEFYPLFSEKQIECQLLIEPEDIKITCDTDKMQRVFDNLLRNALLYGYQQSTIQIRAKQWEKSLFIQVENHGATIPQEKLARIFEQFYRLDTSRQSKTGGAGLGLAIAKEIVERHGGKISAKSQEERTIFTVELPMKIESQSS